MIMYGVYERRRELLMEQFEDTDDVIFLRGSTTVQRNADIEYRFRQNSNLRYLTGIDLPDIAMLLVPKEKKFILFAREYSADDQIWIGKQPSLEELKEQFGADEVYPLGEVREVVDSYRLTVIHSLKNHSSPFCYRRKEFATALVEMRLIKTPVELTEMNNALEVTAKAFDAVMRSTKPGINEQELEAVVEFMWRSHCADYAFHSIVTQDGATLHSENNTNTLEDGRLLLIDIGCELNGYCSDITRTFPVNGKFSPEQAAIYDIVLQAKKECIDMLKPGISMGDVQKHSDKVIAQGLLDYGILKGDLDTILEKQLHRLFFLHGIGHWLGMDCHDCADIGSYLKPRARFYARELEPGNVVTIEPGIYFNESILTDPERIEKYSEFVDFERARELITKVSGIRIEDDVLVTSIGSHVLGPGIPEERDELEEIVGSGGFKFFE